MMSTHSPIGPQEMPTSRSSEPPNRQANEDDARLPNDQLFHLLANQRRRAVLYYLGEYEQTVSMRALAERIAAWEHGTTIRMLGSDERQRVYISLYQNHLPKLDESGVIEYDQSRGTVERTERADQLDRYIQSLPYAESTDRQPVEADRPRGDQSSLVRIAGFCAIGAGVLTSGWLGLISTPLLLALTWIGICLASLFGLALDG